MTYSRSSSLEPLVSELTEKWPLRRGVSSNLSLQTKCAYHVIEVSHKTERVSERSQTHKTPHSVTIFVAFPVERAKLQSADQECWELGWEKGLAVKGQRQVIWGGVGSSVPR